MYGPFLNMPSISVQEKFTLNQLYNTASGWAPQASCNLYSVSIYIPVYPCISLYIPVYPCIYFKISFKKTIQYTLYLMLNERTSLQNTFSDYV